MYTSILATAGLFAMAYASPELVKKQVDPASASALLSEISSVAAEITFPPSIIAELTAVPASVTGAFANPTELASIYNQIEAGQIPSWFTTLPQDLQSYIIGLAPKIQTLVSLEAAAGLITVSSVPSATGGASVTPTAGFNSSATVADVSTTTTSASNSTVTTSKPSPSSSNGTSSSTSKAGAQPTGVLAAGLIGAVGFLGFAMAL